MPSGSLGSTVSFSMHDVESKAHKQKMRKEPIGERTRIQKEGRTKTDERKKELEEL